MVTVTNFPPVLVEVGEEERGTAVELLDRAELRDSLGAAQLTVRIVDRIGRCHRQREATRGAQELLSPRNGQNDDVPGRRRVLDIDGEPPAAGDLQAEHIAVERGARFLVVALERAVRE